MTKLPPIQPTADEMAGDHARRIVGTIADIHRLVQRVADNYKDQPERPTRTVKGPNGQPQQALATPPVTLAAIKARLGPESCAAVEKFLAEFAPQAK
jgi:hypothetical protein